MKDYEKIEQLVGKMYEVLKENEATFAEANVAVKNLSYKIEFEKDRTKI
ncbi:hypothetical protein [Enterococcus faecalis]|uniref:Uncharacterized protein n=1 Tax=Enterococcus faecalis RP2S-4 TaxID=1244145 RepID=A0ABC9TK66_ENTFL|nr:hypothetical protein [Enterococcus faecalis]EPI07502.1 hypothetical protein D358_01956 [Enterococcus faecalis RP2S-4]